MSAVAGQRATCPPKPEGRRRKRREARCTVVRRTRALVFMSAELMVGERVVAAAKGVWKTLGKG